MNTGSMLQAAAVFQHLASASFCPAMAEGAKETAKKAAAWAEEPKESGTGQGKGVTQKDLTLGSPVVPFYPFSFWVPLKIK